MEIGTYSFTGGDAENLGGETNRALNAKVTVSATGNEIARDCSADSCTQQTVESHHVYETARSSESKDSSQSFDQTGHLTVTESKLGYVHFSRLATLLLVKVILILWDLAAGI